MRHQLVLATHNHGKLAELRVLLAGLPVTVLSLDDVTRRGIHVVEDGETFADNAKKKACTVAEATMMLTLADDSGLEVDALGGAPGVRSARFAHERATDAENNAALLSALDALEAGGAPLPRPVTARFRCVLALVDPLRPGADPQVVEGACEGSIARNAKGHGGFGYDPLFVVAGTERTMAELSEEEKNEISHRAKAVGTMRLLLEKVLAERSEQTRRVCE